MSQASRHLWRNQRRPSWQTRKGRVLLLQTVLRKRNKSCAWQQRPETQIQTLKSRRRNKSCAWQQRPETQIQTLKNRRRNKSCAWQQRPETQIQTLKKRHHQRSPPKAMLPKGRSQRKLWGLLCPEG